VSAEVYDLPVENRQRKPVTLRFGARTVAGPTAYPLGLLPLVRAFYAIDGAKVVGQKHNCNLIPPWERTRAAIQVTQHNEAHRGDIVCMRLQHGSVAEVDLEVAGVRAFSRKGQKGVATISLGGWVADDMRDAYRASIAICRALVLTGADAPTIWRDIEKTLVHQLDEVEAEWDEMIMHSYQGAAEPLPEPDNVYHDAPEYEPQDSVSTSAPCPLAYQYVD